MVDIVDIALHVYVDYYCIIILRGGVMSRVNVYLTFLMLLYFRILVASLSNVKCSVMLWSDNRNILIIGFSLQGTVLNMIYSVFNVVKYNSNDVL